MENKMSYQDIISAKLEEIRISKRLTKKDLAKRSGIARSNIYYYENGRSFDLDVLGKLCDGLGIDMFTFLDECKREMEKQKGK